MSENGYKKSIEYFQAHTGQWRIINGISRVAFYAIMLSYGLCYILALLQHDYYLLAQVFVVPGLSFLAVTYFRKVMKRPRPYEVYAITPLIEKESRGNSFPSRHVFSTFIIAMTALQLNGIFGGVILTLGVFLAVHRVLSGVHFIKDVAVGAALGIICGCLGFYVIF